MFFLQAKQLDLFETRFAPRQTMDFFPFSIPRNLYAMVLPTSQGRLSSAAVREVQLHI